MQRALLLSALFACTWPSLAQPEGQRLIKLNVAVTDLKGDPVTDLTAAEVQIKEDGKPRNVAFFRFAGSRRPVTALAPGEITDKPPPPTTVILLDRWNEELITTAMAWTELTHVLQSLETGDGVYIYILTNRGDLLPVRPLPSTAAEAAASSKVSATQISTMLDDAVKKTSGFRGVDEKNGILRFNTTMAALAGIGKQLAVISGRKSLVWVTHGMPLTIRLRGNDWKDFTPELKVFSAAAVLSGLAIYTVDQSGSGAGAAPDVSRETLELVSNLTGGRWYPSDYADRAITGAMADARGNYTVAFYSSAGEKDRKLHKIHLESTRKGLHLQTRDGHYGDTPEPPIDALQNAIFDAVRRSPFDAPEIELRVATTFDPATKSTRFRIRIEPADVLLETSNQHHQGHLSVMLASYADGVLNGASPPVIADLNLTEEQFQQATKDGLIITQEINASAKTQQVRVIVFDRGLRAAGSATVPIPAP